MSNTIDSFDFNHIPLLMMTATNDYQGASAKDSQLIKAHTPKPLSTLEEHEVRMYMLSPTWKMTSKYLLNRRAINRADITELERKEQLRIAQKSLINKHHKRIVANLSNKKYCYWKKRLMGAERITPIITFTSECTPDQTTFCQRYTVIRALMNMGCVYLGEREESNNWLPNGKFILKMLEQSHDIGRVIHSIGRMDIAKHHMHVIEGLRNLEGVPDRLLELLPEEGKY